MALLDLPTRQDMEALAAKLDAVLAQLTAAQAPAATELVSLARVAAYTHFDQRTVRQWVEQGRFDQQGKKVYLPAYEYSGRLRFKLADVDAFGLRIGVLAPSVARESPQPTKKAKLKTAPLPSQNALRLA